MWGDIVIHPSTLCGYVEAPPSKSYGHRLLIAASLCDREVTIKRLGMCDDIAATIGALSQIGAKIEKRGESYAVTPYFSNDSKSSSVKIEPKIIDCGQSGSTARFLLPVAGALGESARFIGSGRLPLRPMQPLTSLLREHGLKLSSDFLPIDLCGKIGGGDYEIDGGISSQFISGLLFALPLLDEGGEIEIVGNIESENYIEMTADVLRRFGVAVKSYNGGRHYSVVRGGYKAESDSYTVEGDWSAAAFWLVAAAIGNAEIEIGGLNRESLQGDSKIIDALKKFGADIDTAAKEITVRGHSALKSAEIDCENIPDLVPILAVAAAYADGKSVFHGIERLRIKESDRVRATISMLSAFGISAGADSHSLWVVGGRPRGGDIDCFGDHRIAMSAAVCASRADGETVIRGADCVSKSYPKFFDDFSKKLGGAVTII